MLLFHCGCLAPHLKLPTPCSTNVLSDFLWLLILNLGLSDKIICFLSPEKVQTWVQFPYSESDSIERYNRGLTERFWRGKEKGLSDLCLLDLSDLSSLIPRSKEAALRRTEQSAKINLKKKNKMEN